MTTGSKNNNSSDEVINFSLDPSALRSSARQEADLQKIIEGPEEPQSKDAMELHQKNASL